MAARSSFRNMTLCLLTICLLCSALLAVVNSMTAAPIAKAQADKTRMTLSRVLPAFDNASEKTLAFEGADYVCYVASADTSVVGYAVISPVIGFGGTLELMVGFDADGQIWSTSVLSHSETPGLGAKCTEAAFKDQFDHFDPAVKSLQVRKDGGDIDAITASTITSRAYCRAVENACRVYRQLALKESAGDGSRTAGVACVRDEGRPVTIKEDSHE